MIEKTAKLASDKDIPISAVLGSTQANLSGGIDAVYHKMQKIDRNLRGGGDPKSVPKRDVSFEIKKMNEYLDRQITIAKDLHFETPETGQGKKKGGLGKKVSLAGIALILAFLVFLFGDNILGRLSRKFGNNKPADKQIETPTAENRPLVDATHARFGTHLKSAEGDHYPYTVEIALENKADIPAANFKAHCRIMINDKVVKETKIDIGSLVSGTLWQGEVFLTKEIFEDATVRLKKFAIDFSATYSGVPGEKPDKYKTSFILNYFPDNKDFRFASKKFE